METPLPDLAEAARLAFEAEQRATEANAAAQQAKQDKEQARATLDAVMEEQGASHIGAPDSDGGRGALYYYVNKPKFDITDPEQVREWAQDDDETYVDPEPKLRESLIFQECRRRYEEKLPLPPGITVRSDKELHRRSL